MFNIKPVSQDRVDIEVSGKLDSAEMQAAIDSLELKSGHIQNGRMLCFVHDFDMPTANALGVEIKQMPGLLRTIRRFDKAAVVADERWIRALNKMEGALVPGLTVKTFESGKATEAETWLKH